MTKRELIVFPSKYKQDLYNDLSITLSGTVVDCSSQVKDLGSSLIECYLYVSNSACVLYLKYLLTDLWNSLRGERAVWLTSSPTVESFKINLKTYLFCERVLS